MILKNNIYLFGLLITIIPFLDPIINKYYFLIFTLSVVVSFKTIVDRNVLFFEKFLLIYFILGSYFKIVFQNFFSESFLSHPNIHEHLNSTLLFCSLIIFFINILSFFKNKVIGEQIKKNNLLKANDNYHLYLIAVLSILIFLINYKFNIFGRGYYVNTSMGKIFSNAINFYYFLLLPTLFSFYLFYYKLNRKLIIMFFCLFIFGAISINSRGAIIYMLPFLIVIIALTKYNLKSTIIYILIMSIISIYTVNTIRNSNFDFSFLYNRWVGIDEIYALKYNQNKLSNKLFTEALTTKDFPGSQSFFDREFYSDRYNNLQNNETHITTPGAVAFFFISGSTIFTIIGISFLILISWIIEYVFYKKYKNIYLSVFIGNILAIRFIHFGYNPGDSYKLILSLLITFYIYRFLVYINKK